jgi:hypothetical protein
MSFKSRVFDEPVLEFGDGGQHCDPRHGLREFGPLQPRSGDVIRVGVIGTEETVVGFTEFLAETARGIDSENKQLINLNPDFPGLGNQNPFRCKFEVPNDATIALSHRQVNEIKKIGRHDEAVRHAVTLISAQLSSLMESSAKPDVIVLALPVPLIEKLVNAKSEEASEGSEEEDDRNDALNFRDLLKAKNLHLDVPTQIVWPDTWDDAAKIPRKVKRESNRQTQAKATRAWNLLNALFYKAGKVPWRLLPDQAEYRTSFLGIGFYRDLDGQQLWTSTAQMFDERGRGLILRGARAQTETKGRHPYLTAADADDLVTQSIAAYKAHHKHVPARVVVLKTSRFRPEEAEGIDAALERLGIDLCDLLWVQESSPIAVFRDGNYPVLRGASSRTASPNQPTASVKRVPNGRLTAGFTSGSSDFPAPLSSTSMLSPSSNRPQPLLKPTAEAALEEQEISMRPASFIVICARRSLSMRDPAPIIRSVWYEPNST